MTDRVLLLDTETRSPRDLRRCGAYRYSESPARDGEDGFELLLADWELRGPDGRVRGQWSPLEGPVPPEFLFALLDPGVRKVAHNAGFDRVVLSRWLQPHAPDRFLPPDEWYDTRAAAAEVGLPGGLDRLARALGVAGKIDEGKDLIRFFDAKRNADGLREAVAAGGDRLRERLNGCYEDGRLIRGRREERDGIRRLLDVLDRWERYKTYCHQDVTALCEVYDRLPEMHPDELELWHVDQRINDRGIRIDTALVAAATERRDELVVEAAAEMKRLTGLANPNSVPRLTGWLYERGYRTRHSPETVAEWEELNAARDAFTAQRAAERGGGAAGRLAAAEEARRRYGVRHHLVGLNSKTDMPELLAQARARDDGLVLSVLELRDVVAGRATKKLDALPEHMSSDGRVRGCFGFYGAGHTGRFVSRAVQFQNLPRVSKADFGTISEACDDPSLVAGLSHDRLKQTLRGVVVADDVFSVADFSAVEARVTAWLAGQDDELRAFERGEDIYLSTWASMTGTRYEDYDHDSPERALGKAATLGCGFGGGVHGINRVGGDRIRPTEEFAAEWLAEQRTAALTAWGFVHREGRLPARPLQWHRLALHMKEAGVPAGAFEDVFGRWAGSGAARTECHDAYIDRLKTLWRRAHPRIVDFWRALENAFSAAAFHGRTTAVGDHIVVRGPVREAAVVRLPSGRELWYRRVRPETRYDEERERNVEELVYTDALGARVHVYGGKLCENVVQATARDLLRTALVGLDRAGEEVVVHIHDEVVVEGRVDLRPFLIRQPEWAAGLPLDADVAESHRYLGH